MSSGQVKYGAAAREDGFETRDFYLACFLRCTGYELLDLRAEGGARSSSSATGRPGAMTCCHSTATGQ